MSTDRDVDHDLQIVRRGSPIWEKIVKPRGHYSLVSYTLAHYTKQGRIDKAKFYKAIMLPEEQLVYLLAQEKGLI